MVSAVTRNGGCADVLIGLQYGDEGKAKETDFLAMRGDYGVVARFNGGSNAGHSLEINGRRYVLQQVPSGVINPNIRLYIGSGCVVNPVKLMAEVQALEKCDLTVRPRLTISPHVSIVQPHQLLIDELTGGSIGTTKNGIGPAYADRARRMLGDNVANIRGIDLIKNFDLAMAWARGNLEHTINEFGLKTVDVDSLMSQFGDACKASLGMITPNPTYLLELVERGEKVLFEGAQSAGLDVQTGDVPYVTSSSTVAGAAFVGGDLPPNALRSVFGVAKLIPSRVGNGPFVGEFGGSESEVYCTGEQGELHTKSWEAAHYPNPQALLGSELDFEVGVGLRMIGNEYGSRTGRPRRIGKLDLEALARAARANGVDVLYLNKADLLALYRSTRAGTMPVVVGPSEAERMAGREPIIEQRPVSALDLSGVRTPSDLPREVLDFVDEIRQRTGARVGGLGVGPGREQFVSMD